LDFSFNPTTQGEQQLTIPWSFNPQHASSLWLKNVGTPAHWILLCRHLVKQPRIAESQSGDALSRFWAIGSLSKAPTKRNVLFRRLKERDYQIVRRNLSGIDNSVVQGLQKAEPLLLRKTACDERKLQPDQILRVVQSEEGPRVPELSWPQEVNDLEEFVRRRS
jgi:hypothetical protein